VNSAHKHRRPRKFRRTGRHTTPSQVEKVAEAAGKAAPAMAIAGVLVASSPAHAGTGAALTPSVVAGQVRTDAFTQHLQSQTRTYTVQPGDTLSGIAERFYGNPAEWPVIYDDNLSVIQNPNVIYAGEVLKIPSGPPAAIAATTATTLTSAASLSGTLSCTQLEDLWEYAGGAQTEAFTAAEIAMAESSGEQYATGTVGERGYWQINPNHGSLSTYDPVGNAKAAVIISADGTDWTPWTTYTSGAYLDRC
jgi:LysM repeat protein